MAKITIAFARRAAEGQYTGWRAKLLGAGPSAALVLAEGDAAPDWLQNDATGALVRSCDANARSCAEYLASAAFDYVVSTGPRGAAKADILARCHPRVVHVRRPAAAAASSS